MNLDELRKLAGMPQTEWANSPANTKHPEPEEVQAPEADVNQSLRQYMNADPMPVKVVEGEDKVFEDHEVEVHDGKILRNISARMKQLRNKLKRKLLSRQLKKRKQNLII